MPSLGTPEIIIIAIVLLVLFGSAKLPKAARSLGQSMRIFKAETKGLRGEDDELRPAAAQVRRARAPAGRSPAGRAGAPRSRGRRAEQRPEQQLTLAGERPSLRRRGRPVRLSRRSSRSRRAARCR